MASFGLEPGEVVLTDYISDLALKHLYSACFAYIFPSLHEGFGLPALEAIRCGAPVIVAHTSSLTEVVDLPEAMFDPYSDMDISRTMERGLADETFRQALLLNGERQSAKFSWTESAARSISAMERLFAERDSAARISIEVPSRPRLAYISPLKPESAIAPVCVGVVVGGGPILC
jgi:glycosyltransferase involved in cell wall biosynthesis